MQTYDFSFNLNYESLQEVFIRHQKTLKARFYRAKRNCHQNNRAQKQLQKQ